VHPNKYKNRFKSMKKSLLAVTVLSLAMGQANAQIKLGNNPTTINADALLEINWVDGCTD
jgi:hypothetical protein